VAGEDDLHGLDAVGEAVADLEHLAHSALAQNADDLVIANRVADLELGRHTSHRTARRQEIEDGSRET
jgi:hypothetical protein